MEQRERQIKKNCQRKIYIIFMDVIRAERWKMIGLALSHPGEMRNKIIKGRIEWKIKLQGVLDTPVQDKSKITNESKYLRT